MPGPGQVAPPPTAPGQADIVALQAAKKPDGTPAFNAQDIAKYKADTTQKLLAGGFTVQQIDAHWGETPPSSPSIAAHVGQNVEASGVTQYHGLGNAFLIGYGQSPAGLATIAVKGGNPNVVMQAQPDKGILPGIANAVGSVAGSLATDFLGMMGGTAAGAAVPGLGETGASEVAGAIGGAFGAGFTTQAMRELILGAYNRGEIHNTSDLMHVIGEATKNSLGAGVASAPFGIAGPVAGAAARRGAGKIGSAVVGGTVGASAAVATQAAIHQHVPDAQDFFTAAIMTATLSGVSHAYSVVKGRVVPGPATQHYASNLQQIWKRDGIPPWEAVERAKHETAIAQELKQQDVNGDTVSPRLHASAPTEPEPVPHHAPAEPDFENMKRAKPSTPVAKPAPKVTSFEDLSTALEGSGDASVSPKGAIGKHQIIIGTARQYGFGEGMSDDHLVQWLHDPANNAVVFHHIANDLHTRFHGDMNAMLIAYNAGPGRASEYLAKGPGTELEAIPDKSVRGGIRYEVRPSHRDESFLPMETQKYLANGRRRSGSVTTDEGGGAVEGGGTGTDLRVFPNENLHAPREGDVVEGGGGGEGKPPSLALTSGEPPEGGRPMGGPDREHYTFDEATDEIMANVGEAPKGPGWRDLIDPERMMQQFVSELTPARNIDNRLVKEGLLDRDKDVGQEDMFRQTYASNTRAGAFVRFGILRIGDNEIEIAPNSPSIKTAADQVRAAGGTMRGWMAYMLSKRTLDKAAQGIKTGFNPDAAEDAVSSPDARMYKGATETFNKVMTGGLEYARDSGYLSQAQVDAMVRDNPAYISMRRIMGDDASFGTGRKGFVPREALRKMEGSDRSIVDPFHATIDNLRVLVTMADRNRAIGSIIGQVEMGNLKDSGLEKLTWDPKATMAEPNSDIFKPYTMEPGPDPAETYAPLLAERAQGSLKPNQFAFYRDGVPERWRANSAALVDLIRKADTPGEVNIIGKIFDTVASLERSGIVLDPSFPLRVPLRHQITAFIADPNHPPPFITMMNGMYDSFTGKGVFKEWVANGGAGAALQDMDLNWLQRDMEKTFEDQGVWSRMANRLQHPLQAYQWMAERFSASANIGYYKMALNKGLSPMKAATMSRTAYLDQAEKAGLAAVNSLAKKVPFLRPDILGTHQFGKAFATRPWETFAYAAGTVSLITAALYAANYVHDKSLGEGHDDEKLDAVPRYIRDTHYVPPPVAGMRIQFPFPPVIGPMFGGMTNRMLDSWAKNDPHAFDDWASSILSAYDPSTLIPAAIKAPLEVETNHNFFTGRPVVPQSVQAADGYMQYTNATTEVSKQVMSYLGKPGLNLTNASPIQLEHLLDGWTGPVGMGILRAVNGRMVDYQTPTQMADIPGVSTFFVRNPQANAQQIDDFYADLKELETAHADFSLAMQHHNAAEIAQAAQGPFYGLKTLSGIEKSLHVMSAALAAINTSKEIPPAEKSQDVDQIVNGMIQLSVMGSGIAATMQGKQPSDAFKAMDQNRSMRMMLQTQGDQ